MPIKMALNLDFKKDPMSPANANKIIETINKLIDSSNAITIDTGDFDNVNVGQTGFYIMYRGPKNSPLGATCAEGHHYYLLQIKRDDNYVFQAVIHLWDEADNQDVFIRRKIAKAWNKWTNISHIADYNTNQISENGYQKFPSGLIIQWGTHTAILTSTEVTTYVTFPIPFPNASLQVFANLRDVGANSLILTSGVGCSSSTKTEAGLKIKSTTNYAKDVEAKIKWFAIGY